MRKSRFLRPAVIPLRSPHTGCAKSARGSHGQQLHRGRGQARSRGFSRSYCIVAAVAVVGTATALIGPAEPKPSSVWPTQPIPLTMGFAPQKEMTAEDRYGYPGAKSMSEQAGGEEVVRLVAASSPQEAHLWRQALEDEGVRCRVVGEYLGGFGIVPPGHPVPELWVHRKDAERASAILEGLQEPRPQHDGRGESFRHGEAK